MDRQPLPFRNLILDMDGVLWRGETPFPGLREFFQRLSELSLGFAMATNNATKTAVQYQQKLASFGIDVPAWRIVNSAEATARYLGRSYPDSAKAYVVGESGLRIALQDIGISLLDGEGFVDSDAHVDFVVVGFDRQACYTQLASAAVLINRGAIFVGTNPDVTFPSESGPLPGAGSLLAFIQTATGVEPTIVGKPGPIIFQQAMERLKGTTADTVMVGDRLSTDIAGARNAGLRTILLLSGVTRKQDLCASDIQPTWIFDDLAALSSAIQDGLQAFSEKHD